MTLQELRDLFADVVDTNAKEMIDIRKQHGVDRSFRTLQPLLGRRSICKLIVPRINDQFRFGRGIWKFEIKHADRRRNSDQRSYCRMRVANSKSDPRTEGKPDGSEFRGGRNSPHVIDNCQQIFPFTTTGIEVSCTLPNAAKIEPDGFDPRLAHIAG